MKQFHPSLEGAQHGEKGLAGFLNFARGAGADGAQPSNFMLHDVNGVFHTPAVIKRTFEDENLSIDGISAHCPFYVHTTAWTGSKTILPFLPKEMVGKSPAEVEAWAEDYILRLLDVCAELGVNIVPMFWGTAFGLEMASGYPWGFFKGPGYDLFQEGCERFVTKTQKVRDRARELGI